MPLIGGMPPVKYLVKSKLTINKYFAVSHDDTMFERMVPDINTASMTPIPAAVERMSTDSISDMMLRRMLRTRPSQIP